MTVYRRGKFYWMRFMFEDKQIQRSTRLTNRREAENYESVFRSRLIKEGFGILERRTVPTLSDFSARFASEIAVQCAAKPRTVQFYAQQMSALLAFQPLAEARLNTIDAPLLSEFIAYRCNLVKRSSVNRALATLRRALRMAQEWRLLDRVPRIRLLPGEHTREFVLSHELESVYLAACPQPLHHVALLILDTGLRLGEALALQWMDFEPQPIEQAQYLFVRRGKTKYARRHVPFHTRTKEMLKARRIQVKSPFLFPGNNPAYPLLGTSLDHLHAQARKDLKLDREFVLHSLRHTYGTRLAESGADAFTIQRLMGHSSVVVSQRYVHPSQKNLDSTVQRMEAMGEKARTELKEKAAQQSQLPAASLQSGATTD
jgi:integrase